MEGKKGFGKSGRNEGYKGTARGGRPTGARSSDFHGGKTSEGGFGKSADYRGGKSSGSKGTGSFGEHKGKSFGARGGKPADTREGKAVGFRGGKPVDSRGGRTTDSRGGRPADNNYGRQEESTFGGYSNTRSAKPAESRRFSRPDSHREDSEAQRRSSSHEDRFPAADEFSANQGDLDKLEGRNSVLEALKAGRSINRIFVAKGEREGSVNQIIAMARQSHILIQEIDRAKLDTMSLTHSHQGVIALTAAKDYVEVDDILARASESGRPPFIIILDEITDSHNFGSILRTANAAGVHGVIIPKRRAVGLTSVVSKASAGAIEYVPVARVTNIVQTIENLKKKNIWVVGTDSTGEKAYFESDLTGPVALVIGSEGEGMGKLVRESCDFVVNIPMMGQISSLNAAVAGAIVTYDILRQRSKKK